MLSLAHGQSVIVVMSWKN